MCGFNQWNIYNVCRVMWFSCILKIMERTAKFAVHNIYVSNL